MEGNGARIDAPEELRSLYGEPSDTAQRKVLPRLDKHCRSVIAASPFLVIGSADASGACDVSPRGDAPGFVAVLDDATLLIPDRRGNKRVDTMGNILENPQVALIFFVPGMTETLRVNGRVEITTEASLLAPHAVNGKPPQSGLVVRVEEAYLHCGKALIRSRLWDPERQIDRKSLPSLGQMIAEQIEGLDVAETEANIEEAYRSRLY